MMLEIFKQSILTKLQPIAKFEPRTAAPHKCHPIQLETGQTNFTLCWGGRLPKLEHYVSQIMGFRCSVTGGAVICCVDNRWIDTQYYYYYYCFYSMLLFPGFYFQKIDKTGANKHKQVTCTSNCVFQELPFHTFCSVY